jgi:rubrerythrin
MTVTTDDTIARRLAAMAAKGRDQQWTVDGDIDWSQNIVQPNWLLRRFHGALISQFRHGELATVRVCRRLLSHVTDCHVRDLLVQQIADEERHARVYEQYMALLGDEAPVDPSMAEAIERALEWRGPPLGLVVAFHVILEGEALRSLQGLAEELPCPLFAQINARISRDEARHVAFGKVYLREHLKTLSFEERMAIYRFVQSLWDDSAVGILSRFRIPGFITQALRRRWVAEGWAQHRRALVDIGLLGADEMARA